MFCFVFGLWVIPGSAQVLFIALCSRMTSSGAQRKICCFAEVSRLAICKASAFQAIISEHVDFNRLIVKS